MCYSDYKKVSKHVNLNSAMIQFVVSVTWPNVVNPPMPGVILNLFAYHIELAADASIPRRFLLGVLQFELLFFLLCI